MIGKLRGTIDSIGEDFVILDVHGVGYVVNCATRTLQNLPAAGEAAALAIETQVREDSIRLYGFLSEDERDWFRPVADGAGRWRESRAGAARRAERERARRRHRTAGQDGVVARARRRPARCRAIGD